LDNIINLAYDLRWQCCSLRDDCPAAKNRHENWSRWRPRRL